MLTLRFLLDDADETEVGYTACPVAPRVDEFIWLRRTSKNARETGKPQMDGYKVIRVAYWMNNHDGEFRIDSGSVAVYVEPVQ